MIEFLEREVLEIINLIQVIQQGFPNKSYCYRPVLKSMSFFRHTNNHITGSLVDKRMHF